MRDFAGKGRRPSGQPRQTQLFGPCLLAALFFFSACVLFAQDAPSIFAARAQAAFDRARARFQSDTNNPVAAWEFARTCYDWADCATNKSQRAAIASQGVAACRRALLFTNSAPCHYYLAMNYGQLAQAEMLHGLRLVREMEHEFKATAKLDRQFDFAGAERGLGLLYRDAPGWPISIGSRQKARHFLTEAATLAPQDPENILNLAESDLKWGDYAAAQKEAEALDALWPKAQTNFVGAAWEKSWDDWSRRRDALQAKLDNS